MIMFVVLALVATALAEPEADPQTLLYHQPTVYSPLLKAFNTYKAAPAVVAPYTYNTVATPAITYNTAPAVTYKASPAVVYKAAPAVAVNTHTLTSYNNPNHYTAVSNGAVGPSYVAKNGPTVHVVKREAEADAQIPLTAFAAPYTHAVTYKAAPAYTYKASPFVAYNSVPAVTYNNVAAPAVTYNTVAAPAVTYKYNTVASPAVTYNTVATPALNTHTLTSYNNPNHYTAVSNGAVGPSYLAKNGPTVHVVKREADAEAYYPYTTYTAPHVYSPYVHDMAYTLTHPSNVGLCLNYVGAQVPC